MAVVFVSWLWIWKRFTGLVVGLRDEGVATFVIINLIVKLHLFVLLFAKTLLLTVNYVNLW